MIVAGEERLLSTQINQIDKHFKNIMNVQELREQVIAGNQEKIFEFFLKRYFKVAILEKAVEERTTVNKRPKSKSEWIALVIHLYTIQEFCQFVLDNNY